MLILSMGSCLTWPHSPRGLSYRSCSTGCLIGQDGITEHSSLRRSTWYTQLQFTVSTQKYSEIRILVVHKTYIFLINFNMTFLFLHQCNINWILKSHVESLVTLLYLLKLFRVAIKLFLHHHSLISRDCPVPLCFVILCPKLIYVDYFHIHPFVYLDPGG